MLESKRRAIIFFLLAVALAAVSGFLVLQKVQAVNTNLGTKVTIYTANSNIDSRQMILPDQVTADQVPQEYVRDEHITDVEELVNKVSVVPLSEGDVITDNMLKDASAVTDANNRLVSVIGSEKVSFDERFFPLDRADIIVSHSFEETPVTEVFMEDVKVARTSQDGEGDFNGVQLEIPYEKVAELIHMQNYADSLRLVKANVSEGNPQQQEGEQESSEGDNPSGDAPEENTEESEGNNNTNEEQESEQSNDNNESNNNENNDGNNNDNNNGNNNDNNNNNENN